MKRTQFGNTVPYMSREENGDQQLCQKPLLIADLLPWVEENFATILSYIQLEKGMIWYIFQGQAGL